MLDADNSQAAADMNFAEVLNAARRGRLGPEEKRRKAFLSVNVGKA